jgi:phosphinothricin acetyltransferase
MAPHDVVRGLIMTSSPESVGRIRVATPDDAPAIQAIYAPYVAETCISFEIDPPDVAEMAARIARIGATFPWLVYEDAGEVIGYAYGGPHRERAAHGWSADSAIYVGASAHRRGTGRALYQTLAAVLDLQGYHCVFGAITLPNAPSVGLHEACGYTPIGVFRDVGYKFGGWRDVGWWGRRLNAPSPDPQPPRRFSPSMLDEIMDRPPA